MNPIESTLPQGDPTAANGAGLPINAPADTEAAFRKKAIGAAEKFEGFFIAQMLKNMRAASRELAPEGSVWKDPANSDMLDFTDHLLADQIAGQHAFGIADAILRQLLPPSAPVASAAFKTGPEPVAFSG